jgi:2-polyprenyl-3-methyl-5-hydroxy-6-metoxy-1,4-benzoquinol methylase
LKLFGRVESPGENELVYQHGFELHGWALYDGGVPWASVTVRLGSHEVGRTRVGFLRPDVAIATGWDASRAGFVIRCFIPEALRGLAIVPLECEVVDEAGNATPLALRVVRFSEIDFRIHGHGYILQDGARAVLVRDQVYGSGPPAPYADPLQVDLVMRYLERGDRVLDVGCGIGAYHQPLSVRGIEWTGCEARSDFVDRMRGQGMNAFLVTDALPFADRTFDAAICIEVLEHIAEYEPFLDEIARVVRRNVVFSVPNFGAVPVSSSFYALPWHMLESDHKNFFTARSLSALLERFFAHVETYEYGPLPMMRSPDEIAINNHILAICSH